MGDGERGDGGARGDEGTGLGDCEIGVLGLGEIARGVEAAGGDGE